MDQMALRVGVKVYMDVLQKLSIRLNDQEGKKSLRLIPLVISIAIKMIHEGHSGSGILSYETALMRNFDAELKKVLEAVDFKDYHDNQKVLKNVIRKAALEEIWPAFEEILQVARGKKLEKLFK